MKSSRVAHQDLPNRFSSWLRPLKGPDSGLGTRGYVLVAALGHPAASSLSHFWALERGLETRRGRHRADGAMIKTWVVSQSIFIGHTMSYGHGDLPIVRSCKILFRIPQPQFLLGQIVNTNNH